MAAPSSSTNDRTRTDVFAQQGSPATRPQNEYGESSLGTRRGGAASWSSRITGTLSSRVGGDPFGAELNFVAFEVRGGCLRWRLGQSMVGGAVLGVRGWC